VLVCAVVMRLGTGHFEFDTGNLAGFAVMAASPSLSGQIATAWGWRRIEAAARSGRAGWPTGIGIGMLTHVLFAALGMLLGLIVSPIGGQWLEHTLLMFGFLFVFSLLLGGLFSLPLAALSAQWAATRRRKELAHVAA
jgi:hypothetical protein